MSLRLDLEKAIEIYQPQVEEIMQTELGHVQVKSNSLIGLYKQTLDDEICRMIFSSTTLHNIQSRIMAVANISFGSIAYISPFDDESNIYTGLFPQLRYTKEDIRFIACHEMTHLAHKKIVGHKLLMVWPIDNREDIANYVAAEKLEKIQEFLLSNTMKKYFNTKITGKFSFNILANYLRNHKDITEYIIKTSDIVTEQIKSKPEYSSINFRQ